MDRTWADGRICRTRTGWLFFESSSRSIFLFEHDLRANASRLSRGKTGTHFSGSCSKRGRLRRVRYTSMTARLWFDHFEHHLEGVEHRHEFIELAPVAVDLDQARLHRISE